MVERIVTVDLGDGMRIAASAEQQGPQLVADESVVAKLTAVTTPIEKVSRDILEAVKRASPSRGSVELGFALAIEQGQLIALFGKARGEATIKVILEWSAATEAK